MSNIKQPITRETFEKIAEVAANDGCLKRRDGEFGTDWAIILNGHLMMAGIVNEDGERDFFQYF